MPYDPSDPRSRLSTAVAAPPGIPRPATYRELHRVPADEGHPKGSKTWWTRTQAMVIAHTEAAPGDVLSVDASGEYAVLVTEGAGVTVEHGPSAESVDEFAVVIMPSGTTTVRVTAPGVVIRVFGAPTVPDLAARCANAADYESPDENVAEFVPWPAPPAGERIRVYRAADYPDEPGRLGRLFRCTTVMVNAFDAQTQPRDTTILSPHHHDDFEQVSLQIDGDFTHHMRVPWAANRLLWRDDEHRLTEAPATVVIPPPLLHTSQPSDTGRRFLIDVFAPPRFDFSEQPGWVLNADEYPMPETT
ncbi:hypothetical protein [Desertimonas flava]|jgi:hypothetical protein|uniref:hypothetical protein n=1 Tax=Desertimonas flava TaxID=2064846 RepID=UPI000E350F35|nr:hypothetical protein [Desertimonas flava]